jgi:DNA repair protein RadA/Sms
MIVFGEIGLDGEVRSVAFTAERLLEVEKLGFKKAIIPKINMKNLSYKGKIEIFMVSNLEDAIKILKSQNLKYN